MKSYTRICARINLDAIEQNIEHLRGNLAKGVKMIVVVKADAYGHGAIQTTSLLSLKEYVWGFAVATLDEAIVLRRSGIINPSWCWDACSRSRGWMPSKIISG